MKKYIFSVVLANLLLVSAYSQGAPNENQLGAWYMYFFNADFGDSGFGIQGDYQFRFWEPAGDLEQILLRTGFTYAPKQAGIKFTFGYGNVTSGAPGESTSTVNESRIYQEALFPQKIGGRFFLTHRLRYEQRWVEGQDFRTRYRYNLFVNVPLNRNELGRQTLYLALYNELFINGQDQIGQGRTVDLFDRNRTYLGLGYGLRNNMRIQAGWMKQTTANWSKGQLQLSLHHHW